MKETEKASAGTLASDFRDDNNPTTQLEGNQVRRTRLVVQDRPIPLLPRLAERLGMNEAIVLQQLHHWLNWSIRKYGRPRIYNSYERWKENFPFMGLSTIKRTFRNLEREGIVVPMGNNRTKWYSIDYLRLDGLLSYGNLKVVKSTQNEPNSSQNGPDARRIR